MTLELQNTNKIAISSIMQEFRRCCKLKLLFKDSKLKLTTKSKALLTRERYGPERNETVLSKGHHTNSMN